MNFTADRFVILPYQGGSRGDAGDGAHRGEEVHGEKVAVNFSLHRTDAGWKAWDVVIEGISYVKSFRTDFAAEIQQKGLDEVIARFEKETAANASPAPSGVKTRRRIGRLRSAASRSDRRGSRSRRGFARFSHRECAVAPGASDRRGQASAIDLAGVTESDSAGLALLIEWLSVAQRAGRSLRYENIPLQLHQLARLSNVEELIGVG